MFKKTPGPDQHFNAYYEDNSLLIQFMMVEFVQSHQLTYQIKALIQQQLNSNQTSEKDLFCLMELLEQLVGHFPQEGRSSYFRWTMGSLTKLKEYCEQFSRNSFHQNKQHIHLHMVTYQAWLKGLHILELLNSSPFNPYTQHARPLLFIVPIQRAFSTLHMRFAQIIRCIPRVINDYLNNENVMLCLLRKKAQFMHIYGADCLSKRFKWPIRAKELTQLLIQRYQERGFESLIPIIQQMSESQEAQSGDVC